ncbi:MAG: hypothetical protein U1E25_05045 [Methylocystis sp.]
MDEISESAQSSAQERPPLRPRWLHPVSAVSVITVMLAYFASGIYWPQDVVDLGGINAELIPEGVSLEAGDPAPEGDSLDEAPPIETAALPEEEIVEEELISEEPPPPLIMEPEAVPEPEKKVAKKVEKKEKPEKPKKVEQKVRQQRQAASSGRRAGESDRRYGLPGGTGQGSGTARVAGRFGLPGGSGEGDGGSQTTCLAQIYASIRGHTPATTSLGPATVNVTFYVNSGGGISGISVSGGSAAHAALARRIVASSRGPSSCRPVFARQGITFQ